MLWIAILLSCPGCYHLRLEPVPLVQHQFSITKSPPNLFAAIHRGLVRDGFIIEQEDKAAASIQTGYRFFYKASGIGQPEGGRDYYYKLKIDLQQTAALNLIKLEPVELEMRSFYLYDLNGNLQTLGKRYPYTHYPGMFDLPPLNIELQRVETLLKKAIENSLENIGRYGTDGL